ncbi:MAG TPA: hypothetical protein VER35_02790 [Candidatus Limnocylindrales bacterium]|nr:hypothetical protein [Candidatus Limnocylindrales bacterium]
MVKKSEEKATKETTSEKNFFNLWVNNSNEFLTLWGDSNLKLYKPWIEFIGEKSMKITDMSMNNSPIKYKEFYDDWMKTYKSTYGKISPAEISSPEEALKGFVKCADESNKLYMSWIEEFEENSKKTAQVLNNGNDPAKYRECFDSWITTYEKVIDDLNEHPAIKYQRDVFGSYTGMPDLYSESIAKMAKQIKELYARLYVPSDDSMKKFSDGLAKLSRGDVSPETYKEFYDMWLNTYKETFSTLFDPQTMKPSKELLDDLKESTDISINLFKSWTEALEKMSSKMEDQSKLINDPEAFKEFYNLWVKMYEKTSEEIIEGVPLVSPLKEIMEPLKSACKVFSNTSIKMSKMWMDSFNASKV